MTETTALPGPPERPSSDPSFVRPREGRMLAGVCAGIAERWSFDVTLVRIAAVALTLLNGVGLIAYVAAWLLSPSVDGPAPLAADSEFAAAVSRRGGRLTRRLPALLLIVLAAAIIAGLVHRWWFGVPICLVVVTAVLLGLFATRAGRWLAGILAVLVVAAVAVVGFAGPHLGSRTLNVTSIDDLHSSYDYGIGTVRLDLSSLPVTGDHTTHVRLGRGSVTVTLPGDTTVVAHGHAGVGSVTINGHETSGIDVEQTQPLGAGPTAGDQLTVDVQVGVGSVNFRQA